MDLIRAVLAAAAAAVLPGYFWAAVLRPTAGLGERLAYSTVLSASSVPVIAVIIARAAGTGVTLWVALAAAVLVFGTGLLVLRIKGPAPGSASPLLPRPAPVRDPRVLALVAAALAAALLLMAARRPPLLALLLIALALLAGGALMVWSRPAAQPGDGAPAGGRGPGGATPGTRTGPGPESPGTTPGARTGPGIHTGPGTTPGAGRAPVASGGSPAGGAGGPAGPAAEARQSHARTSTATAPGGPQATQHVPVAGPPEPPAEPAARRPFGLPLPLVRDGGLAAILVLTALRAYSGVVRYDWPYVRGGDQFSHAVMAEQMLAHGQYNSYLIYPPGFSTMTAVICRFAGLTPLRLFPVLAPMLLVVTAAGAYALATRLWGWEFGLAAAALSGLVLTGAYNGFAEGRYPDLISAFFLMVMTVAALVTLYEAPGWRSVVLVSVVGASPVLYHSVATLYAAVLLALVAIVCVPYLLVARHDGEARHGGETRPGGEARHGGETGRLLRALLLSLGGVVVLAACYGAYIYNIGRILGGHSATSSAVSIVLGSQSVPGPGAVLKELGPPIVWFGLLGVAALAAGLRHLARPGQVLAVLTVLGWCLLMYLGSRTSVDGFPQRFERDLGAPLVVAGAFGIGLVARSVAIRRPGSQGVLAMAAATAAVLAGLLVVWQTGRAVAGSDRNAGQILTRPVAAAGRWLAAHNTGGNIITTPNMNPGVTNRGVLALGNYTGLQSYSAYRVQHPRSLPTAGRGPLLDSQQVLRDPRSCASVNILASQDVRYVVLYRFHSGADLAGFSADPAHYRRVFENRSVIIYATTRAPCS